MCDDNDPYILRLNTLYESGQITFDQYHRFLRSYLLKHCPPSSQYSYVVSFFDKEGHQIIYTIHSRDEYYKLLERAKKEGWKLPDINYELNDLLKRRYGITYQRLLNIVNSSKSQPEAIAKLRKLLTGSTTYNPKYHDLEVLVTLLQQEKEFGYLPEAKKELNDYIKSLISRSKPTFVRKPSPPIRVQPSAKPTQKSAPTSSLQSTPTKISASSNQHKTSTSTHLNTIIFFAGIAIFIYLLLHK